MAPIDAFTAAIIFATLWSTEDLAQVSEFPERDLALDCWDVVNFFPDGGVLDVLIDDLTHFDTQNSPNPPVQKYFEGVNKSFRNAIWFLIVGML